MLEYERWNQLRSDIEDILNMCVVTINLTNIEEDRVFLVLRNDHPHYMSWAITRKLKLDPYLNFKFDGDCITVAIDATRNDYIICVDEQNSHLNLDHFPELLKLKHKISNPDFEPGGRLFTFYVDDKNVLVDFIGLLDKQVVK